MSGQQITLNACAFQSDLLYAARGMAKSAALSRGEPLTDNSGELAGGQERNQRNCATIGKLVFMSPNVTKIEGYQCQQSVVIVHNWPRLSRVQLIGHKRVAVVMC
jgi:hypothetical protein